MLENKLVNFRNEQKEKDKKNDKSSFLKQIYDSISSNRSGVIASLSKKKQQSKIFKTKSDLKREKFDQLKKVLATKSTLEDVEEEVEEEEKNVDNISKFNFLLKFILWLVLFIIFIKLEFGLVYFIISMIYGVYVSTGKKSNKKSLSAYSVFNPNLERLDGTFTSEHVEKSLRNML